METSHRISVVIPTLNEAGALPATVASARRVPEVMEIIVVDGGSTDATLTVARELGCRVFSHARSRGGQLRAGAMLARGDVVLLLHADTWLPTDAGRAIANCLRDAKVVGGGFWKIFREPSWLMRGSRWRCAVRFYFGKRFMGDQAIFVRRAALEKIGGVPDVPLMEEFELCRRLRAVGRLALANVTVSTSARRFTERGVIRTYARMWRVTLQYWLGTPPEKLARLYEKC
ncbi:MAG: TIGR04283 family arsenosugar biosynthesis glycosyltransferase [Verrucomicrobia bacterium]|nr:TIGR04283 family arsenosugar biosynthesis glycosyltransferase [Verrucomicrobiota bacterium]